MLKIDFESHIYAIFDGQCKSQWKSNQQKFDFHLFFRKKSTPCLSSSSKLHHCTEQCKEVDPLNRGCFLRIVFNPLCMWAGRPINILSLLNWRQACRAVTSGGAGGALAPQFLADQFTLSQPGGAHSPHPVLRARPDFQTLRRPWHVCLSLRYKLWRKKFISGKAIESFLENSSHSTMWSKLTWSCCKHFSKS